MGIGARDRWEQGAEMGTGKKMEQVQVGSGWEVGKEIDEMEDRLDMERHRGKGQMGTGDRDGD